MIRQLLLSQQLVKTGNHSIIIITGVAVDGEDARRIADTQHLLAGELPVHIPGQGGQKVDIFHMVLAVEDGLVKVGHAPALGDIKMKASG